MVGEGGLAGQAEHLIAQLHPGDGDAGLLHDALFGHVQLAHGGMVEQLVRAARAADHRDVGGVDAAGEAHHGVLPLLNAGDAVVLEQAFEAAHHLVGLGDGILIGIEPVLIGHLEDVGDRGAAALDDVGGKVQIFLLAGQIIQPHERLQHGAGVQAVPVAGGLVDLQLALVGGAELFDHVVGMAAQRGENVGPERFVRADLEEILHPQQDVFAAPDVPAVEFLFRRIGGEAAECVLRGEHIAHGRFERLIERRVARGLIGEAAAAHHLAPVFAAPAAVGIVHAALAELIDEQLPQIGVEQLDFFDIADGIHQRAGKDVAAGRQLEERVGVFARRIGAFLGAEIVDRPIHSDESLSFTMSKGPKSHSVPYYIMPRAEEQERSFAAAGNVL